MPVVAVCSFCKAPHVLQDAPSVGATLKNCPNCGEPLPQNLPSISGTAEHEPNETASGPATAADVPTAPSSRPASDAADFPFLAPPEAPDELGRLGPYRVLGRLGSGGMGVVFRAEDPQLRRHVALKVMLPHFAAKATAKARFLREARAQAAIEHDHVAAIFQVGEDRGVPFIAMPLLKGQSLADALRTNPRLPMAESLRIAREMADGLAAAHELGLVHRDIKPANVWLEGDRRRVKILDFGLARAVDDERDGQTTGPLTQTGAVIGTPAYMSPEQARGEPLDTRSDLFSLGIVIYQMLGGQAPFRAASATGVLIAIASETPTRLTDLNPAVPAGVAELVEQLLAKDRTRRPQKAVDVISILDREIARLPVAGLPDPQVCDATERPNTTRATTAMASVNEHRRSSRRRIVALVALIAILVVIVVAIATQVFRNTSDEDPASPQTPSPSASIKVGVLRSLNGPGAVSESLIADAALLAIDELNAAGGILGRPVEPVVVDGQSNPEEFVRQAEKLLDEKAVAMIHCGTSQRAVREVLNRRNDGLLLCPVPYEGLDDRSRVISLGPVPNQTVLPAIDHLIKSVAAGGLGKKRLYLVGSDCLYSRVVHEIIRDHVKLNGSDAVQIVGESFIPLGSDQTYAPASAVAAKGSDAIVSSIFGRTNGHLFVDLRKMGVEPHKIPTLSLGLTENEVAGLNPSTMAGDYLAASYFQSVERAENRDFLRKLRERYGPDRVATDSVAAADSAVRIWVKGVEKAASTDPIAVRDALRGMEFAGVRAHITIDAENLHAWLPARIGRIRADGSVELVSGAGSERPIRPIPFPATRTRSEWDQFLKSLYFKWDGKWQPPNKN